MGEAEATAEVFITAFKALPQESRDRFLAYLAQDPELLEDLMDLAVIEQRRSEPSRPLREVLGD
ncbi:MAG: hypothetical protein H7A21_13800 [Spirochaetales bacterium]|nr:hypothetical protein [Leptospiraceae bacterium]MCP5482505.1 hypothetical protein [Spirochaetales bacterium]MCP5485791.1 hypothetical protein [Spirochaetales bacterium]